QSWSSLPAAQVGTTYSANIAPAPVPAIVAEYVVPTCAAGRLLQDWKLSNGLKSMLTLAPTGTGRAKVAVTLHDRALGSLGVTSSSSSPGPGSRRAASHRRGAGSSASDIGGGAVATERAVASIEDASSSRESTSFRQ